jgi:hypothetical protein
MRNDLHQLLLKLALLFLLVTLVSVGFIISIPPDYSSYLSAILDKHKLLIETPAPRIILVGGSNIAFGMDSELLQNEMKLPVINDGLHAGLGMEFMLNDLKPYIARGDVIILSMEYDNYIGYKGDLNIISGVLEVDAETIRSLSHSQLLQAPGIIVEGLRNKFNQKLRSLLLNYFKIDSIYTRSGFDKHGDVISQFNKTGGFSGNDPYMPADASVDAEALIILNNFHDFATARGAKLYLVFPAARQSNCANSKAQFQILFDYLKANLKFPVISRPEDFCFPDEFFFDTAYHLDERGTRLRTLVLAGFLKNI